MRNIAFIILVNLSLISYGQCLSGDCNNGFGVWKYIDKEQKQYLIYKGMFENGKYHGKGEITSFSNKNELISRFEGTFVHNQPNEEYYSIWTFNNGMKFEGFKNGMGTFYYEDGKYERGLYKDGKLVKVYDRNSIIKKITSVISLEKSETSNLYYINAKLNKTVMVKFIFDSGASIISISPGIYAELLKYGLIQKEDVLDDMKFTIADGSVIIKKTLIIREVEIGGITLRNILATVNNTEEAPLLLGQSVLQKFGTVTIDNHSHKLYLQ
ncbi:MAG: retroviral-like aspartic protease family protein [Flavobacteriales bacterium]|nr:retroviral-like aspartic protease family protein [Flavobacteriales bacterium]